MSVYEWKERNLRYADDTFLMAHSSQQFQSNLDGIKKESGRKGLNINL